MGRLPVIPNVIPNESFLLVRLLSKFQIMTCVKSNLCFLLSLVEAKTQSENGKLDEAIQRAEDNVKAAEAIGDLDNQSYSYLYLLFKS